MFCCLRTCLNGNIRNSNSNGRNIRQMPEIHLDPTNMGPDVILLSNHLRMTGSGGALLTAPLVQSKSYFEVKIQQSGNWSIGLATPHADLTKKVGGSDKNSWCLCSDNATRHNNEEYHPVKEPTKKETITVPGLIGIEDLQEDLLLTTGKSSPIVDATIITQPVLPERNFPDEGDIVGVAFDHVELNFYFNGKNLDVPFRNVKGDVHPVLYVGNGTILDIILENFHYGPPSGFDKIMLEQSLL